MIANNQILRNAYERHRSAMTRLQDHLEAIDQGAAAAGDETFRLIAGLDRAHEHFMAVLSTVTDGNSPPPLRRFLRLHRFH